MDKNDKLDMCNNFGNFSTNQFIGQGIIQLRNVGDNGLFIEILNVDVLRV